MKAEAASPMSFWDWKYSHWPFTTNDEREVNLKGDEFSPRRLHGGMRLLAGQPEPQAFRPAD